MLVTFNNFKSFPDLKKSQKHTLDFGRINLLYGYNNSGKSSILQILKLFSRNYEDLSSIKTIYDDLSLGSYKNIINNKAENYDFNIDFINQYTDEGILKLITNQKGLVQPGISFHYSLDENKKDKPISKLNNFRIYFKPIKAGNDSKTYLEFDKWRNFYLLDRFEISEKSELFNFSKLSSFVKDKKSILLKEARQLRWEFQNTHKKIKSSLMSFNVIKSIANKGSDKYSQKMMEKIFQNAGLGLFHDKLFNFRADDSSSAYRVSKGRLERSKNNSEYFELENATSGDLSISFVHESQDEEIIELLTSKIFKSKIEYFIKYIDENILNALEEVNNELHSKDVDLSQLYEKHNFLEPDFFDTKHKDIKIKKLDKFIKNIDDIKKNIKELIEIDISFYIDQYYRKIGNPPKKQKVLLFLGIALDDIDHLIKFANNKNDLDDEITLRTIFQNCNENSLNIKEVSENSEIIGFENNILRLINRSLDLPLELAESPILNIENFSKLINQFKILRPLYELVSINNDNCSLNKRFYQVEDFNNENILNKYNQTNIVNNIKNDPILLEKINKQIEQIGFELKFNFIKENTSSEIIQPILEERNNKKGISFLADAGYAIKKIIPLLYHFNFNRDGVIALEEPEANIHPRYQANLADVFVDSLYENNNEFVIETHSELIVLRFLKLIREKKLDYEDFSIHFIEKNKEGSSIKKIEINEDGSLGTSWPGGFFKERLDEFF
jgi:predicted ATPase